MGGLFDAIGDFLGSIVDVVMDFLSAVGEFVVHNILEPIMNFLGFTDETIYQTDVIAVSVFDENLFHKTQVQEALRYGKNQDTAVNYIKKFANTGDVQFGKYYRQGKWDYLDYLPSAQINAVTLPLQDIERILKNEVGNDIFIVDILTMVPSNDDWCKYQLQEKYNYDIGEDLLFYNGEYYRYSRCIYDADIGSFKAVLTSISSIITYEYVITDVSIVGTPVSLYCGMPDIYCGKEGVYCGVQLELRRTTKTNQYTFARADNGSIIGDTILGTSTTVDEYVPVDSTSPYTIIELEGTSTSSSTPHTITLNLPSHSFQRAYLIKYTTINNGALFYWYYDPSTNKYPAISHPVEKIIGFEMYPIAMLRNYTFDINDYNISEKDGIGKPSTISKQRYEDTVSLLSSIGVSVDDLLDSIGNNPDISKIQDAFFTLSVSPSDTDKIVSRVLFELFDYIYDKIPITPDSDSYSMAIKEHPFNAAMAWIPSDSIISNEVIGGLGDCTHSIHNIILTSTKEEVSTITVQNVRVYGGREGRSYWYEYTETVYTREVISDNTGFTRVKTSPPLTTKRSVHTTSPITEGTTTKVISSSKENSHDLVVKKQITKNTVKTIKIVSPTAFHIIRRGSYSGGVSLDVDDKDYVIPLPVPVVERLTILEKTALLGRSTYLLFYAYEETHLKWYQTSAFASFLKVIMIAITVVITIATWGSGTEPTITLTGILFNALEGIVIGVALQIALKLVAKYVDSPLLKAILSAVVMVAALYVGGAFDEFTGITAAQLALIPVKCTEILMQGMGLSLNNEINEFTQEYNERSSAAESLLQDLNSGLSTEFMVDLTMKNVNVTSPSLYTFEEYYEMAINSYKNYDILYENPIANFAEKRLSLGFIEE